MLQPTIRGIYVRNVHDAQVLMHAVDRGILKMIPRRLDDDERQDLRPGDIYVWEERSNDPMDVQAPDAMQRWTDGRHWGASKARDEFLLYTEKDHPTRNSLMTRNSTLQPMRMIKQTYSAFVHGPGNTKKWHLIAYYTSDGRDTLRTIDHIPELRSIKVPPGRYTCARAGGQRKATRAPIHPPPDEDAPSLKLSASYPQPTPSPTAQYGDAYLEGSASPASQYGVVLVGNRYPHCQLEPLEYLESLPPVRRDPTDETALRAFRRQVPV